MTDAEAGPPESPRLRVSVLEHGSEHRIDLDGEIDVATAAALAWHLDRAASGDCPTVGVGLESVAFVDSTGLRVLLEADRRLRDGGRQLVLRSPSPPVARLLELTALGDWLTIEP